MPARLSYSTFSNLDMGSSRVSGRNEGADKVMASLSELLLLVDGLRRRGRPAEVRPAFLEERFHGFLGVRRLQSRGELLVLGFRRGRGLFPRETFHQPLARLQRSG